MTKKKPSPNENEKIQENPDTEDLRARLEGIRQLSGVSGYILKDATSAVIDFEDSAKTVEYALLSSQAFESSEELGALFPLGEIENMLIKGAAINMLCVAIGEATVSVFLGKDANPTEVLANLMS